MASDKKEKKLEKLLDGLSNGKLSLVEIGELLSTNRSNSYNLLNELKDRGYEIKKEVDGKRVSYYITEEVTQFTHISKNTLNKYMILSVLNRPEKFTRPKLVKFFEESNEDNPSVIIRKSRLYELIHEMIREKEIYMDGDTLRVSGKTTAALMSFHSVEDLYTLYYKINALDKDSEEYKTLANLNKKIAMLIGNVDQSVFSPDIYTIDSKAAFDMDKVSKSLSLVADKAFRNKVVRLSYQTKNKGIRTVLVGIGMIVFAPLKAKAFIMGWGYDEAAQNFPKNHLEIIPADMVSSAENTEYENPFYLDEFFKNQFNDMFLVSSEGARPVEVRFDKTDAVSKKVYALSKHRPKSSLKATDSKLLYYDSVSGMNDLIAYLNTYTNSAKIIKPKRVIDDQKMTIQKALKRYGEV